MVVVPYSLAAWAVVLIEMLRLVHDSEVIGGVSLEAVLYSNEGALPVFLAAQAGPAEPLSAAASSSRLVRPRSSTTSLLVLASAAFCRGGETPCAGVEAKQAWGGVACCVRHRDLSEPRPRSAVDLGSSKGFAPGKKRLETPPQAYEALMACAYGRWELPDARLPAGQGRRDFFPLPRVCSHVDRAATGNRRRDRCARKVRTSVQRLNGLVDSLNWMQGFKDEARVWLWRGRLLLGVRFRTAAHRRRDLMLLFSAAEATPPFLRRRPCA